MTDSATKRPWVVSALIGSELVDIDDADDNLVCGPLRPEHAALIVRAVNAHEDLVEALLSIEACLGDPDTFIDQNACELAITEIIRATLSKLEQQS